MITCAVSGYNLKKFSGDLNKLNKEFKSINYDRYGQLGVELLKENTPTDSGDTREAWAYEIANENGIISIIFNNYNVVDDVNIAVIIEHGHVSKNGTWVSAKPFMRKSLNELIKKIQADITKNAR